MSNPYYNLLGRPEDHCVRQFTEDGRIRDANRQITTVQPQQNQLSSVFGIRPVANYDALERNKPIVDVAFEEEDPQILAAIRASLAPQEEDPDIVAAIHASLDQKEEDPDIVAAIRASLNPELDQKDDDISAAIQASLADEEAQRQMREERDQAQIRSIRAFAAEMRQLGMSENEMRARLGLPLQIDREHQ
jgi:hypothetical protein